MVTFTGEQSVDDGGLFRECLSVLCDELKNKVLPLLIKTKNQQQSTGFEREMYTLNPKASTKVQLKMLEFLGALMGFSIRSGILLDLDISRFVWKQITDDEVTIDDLELSDFQFVKDLKDILAKSKVLGEQEFNSEFKDRFMVTLLSNREETEAIVVDLVENGASVPLTKANAQLFYDKSLELRLQECKT